MAIFSLAIRSVFWTYDGMIPKFELIVQFQRM